MCVRELTHTLFLKISSRATDLVRYLYGHLKATASGRDDVHFSTSFMVGIEVASLVVRHVGGQDLADCTTSPRSSTRSRCTRPIFCLASSTLPSKSGAQFFIRSICSCGTPQFGHEDHSSCAFVSYVCIMSCNSCNCFGILLNLLVNQLLLALLLLQLRNVLIKRVNIFFFFAKLSACSRSFSSFCNHCVGHIVVAFVRFSFVHALGDLRLIHATTSMAQVKTTVRVSPIMVAKRA